MTAFNLPEPTICDMNCFLAPGHVGLHQWQWSFEICSNCEGTGIRRIIKER